ncbi:MAG TPA: sensor domain-containing diguanylate cyclase, partial [Thiohalobacter sp.]|nr:sensor domain-containing diguanylate cyclase [Thiohalobacter sp.]
MDATRFSDAFTELNHRCIKLVEDLSALRALSDLGRQERRDEAELLRTALHILLEHNDFERCSLFLLENGVLTCRTGLDWRETVLSADTPPPSPREFRLGEGIIGLAAETGNLQHCRNCREETRFAQPEVDQPVGSLICIPVAAEGRVLGVLNVSHGRVGFFSEQHERLLELFASFLGQLIANWRYTHQMETEVTRRTRELRTALTEAEELKRRYQQLSVIDELTGIHNRRFFFPEAQSALASAVRHQRDFSLMMIDLDRFKQINDNFGHTMGDKVLQVTAALLKGQTREGDVIARFGGEEFVLALPDTDMDGAVQLAERILHSLRSLEFSTDQGTLKAGPRLQVVVQRLQQRRGTGQADLTQAARHHGHRSVAAKQVARVIHPGHAHGDEHRGALA